ncbi:CPCC family cysteine-rich protein [Streptomyces sp. NPDC006365]|uniref:CPCC family cysteine-rich protein n=1 Tax=Streptomyces sp. NPDC006365 TaxID=3364744 RepID=UPI0036CB6992
MVPKMNSYPCPCCGHLVHENPPGSFRVCPVCGWEDDLVQLRWPGAKGANRYPLIEAQQLYRQVGVADPVFARRFVGQANPGRWSLDSVTSCRRSMILSLMGVMEAEWPEDRTRLYWWRPHFWRR